MKKILIITPHYPPSNLAAVHRSRLFAQHLPSFGWEPILLTVHENFYEEKQDPNLVKLLPVTQRIEKVKAFKITKPRLIGDIGLRAFFQLRAKALQLVKEEKIDFVYIPIPSFYVSLIGNYLKRKTGVKFGIDYIDPWVHVFPGSDKLFSRHWLSTKIAKFLEPRAVKNASLITGVAEGYYKGVIERNPQLSGTAIFGAMPYGGEQADHNAVNQMNLTPFLFQQNQKLQLVYAGAMLPKAYAPLEAIFKSIKGSYQYFSEVEFHFIGTGKYANDAESYNIKPLAEKYGLWRKTVFEYPQRIAYMDVLVHLNAADGVFILGSTEPHYTPSKTYQAVLSEKPILAVLHKDSTAVKILESANAGLVISFNGENEIADLENQFSKSFGQFTQFVSSFKKEAVNRAVFNQYSAKEVTMQLVNLLSKIA
jgi:hypothetical protein